MTAPERNWLWVRDHAIRIAVAKRGYAHACFAVGEVVEALGFTRNTVQKYVDLMIQEGILVRVEISPSIVFYRFAQASHTSYTDYQTASASW